MTAAPSQAQLRRAIAYLASKLPPDMPLAEDIQDIVSWALGRNEALEGMRRIDDHLLEEGADYA